MERFSGIVRKEMQWGLECRSKFIKQLPAKPTEPRQTAAAQPAAPGPTHYEVPQILGGNGYSAIKRSPAYSFGLLTPVTLSKPAAKPTAPVFNIYGMARKGTTRITHSVVTPHIEPLKSNTKVPGPGAYTPRMQTSTKRIPSYSMQKAAKPPREPWDMWTPSANMYWPPIPDKRAPSYSLGYTTRLLKGQDLPGPGDHDPKFNFVKRTRPSFSFGAPMRHPRKHRSPAPNTYCEKKFMYTKRTAPAPSFGIIHTPYLGKQDEYIKSSKLNPTVNQS